MHNTVSIEVAKQLKEAGWRKRTYFCYTRLHESSSMFDDNVEVNNYYVESVDTSRGGWFAYAPQLHEILDELPKLPYQGSAVDPLASQDVIFAKTESGYAIRFTQSSIFVSKNNPHDAAALLWIWCVKNII